MKDIGRILPVDGFKTYLNDSLPQNYSASLIHLYQPLIGIEATHLYQLLLQEANVSGPETIQTHHTLMNHLNLPLDVIYRARLKLEGIGLLITYKYHAEQKEVYTYELYAPFSPGAFFNDMMLAELLYQHIGSNKFNLLTSYYTRDPLSHLGENITVSFNDVFATVVPKEGKVTPVNIAQQHQPALQIGQMDYNYLKSILKKKMIPAEKVLTDMNKRVINQLKELYELDQYEIEKSLLWALTEENELDIEQFKAACNDLFRGKHNNASIRLTEKKIDEKEQTENAPVAQQSKTDKLTKHLEKITPRQLLEDLSAGKNASTQDMKMISDIMTKQGLSMSVMNVAIYYCLLQSNMKLSKAYLETIASHWSRLGFKTAKQAIEHALIETQPKAKSTPKRNYQSTAKSQEVIPDWFKNRKQKQKAEKISNEPSTGIDNKEHEEMIALLQKHASKNNG